MKIEKTVKKNSNSRKDPSNWTRSTKEDGPYKKSIKELRVIKLIRAYGECLATNS